ncbi:MAG: glycosyltransferase family 2 protein [Candidatus Zhuqueibacterota bacterium]
MISVIIPVYNCKTTLPDVLHGLAQQKPDSEMFEVIVVDDGSTDGSQFIAREFSATSPVWTAFLSQPNQGAAAARNTGIQQARGEILLFLDADIIPTPTLLAEHAAFHRTHPAVTDAVRGRVILSPAIDLSQQVVLDQTYLKDEQPLETRIAWTDFVTNNISLKQRLLTENNLRFDERMLRNEDVELGYRLTQVGLRLFYHSGAVGYHHHPMTLAKHIERAKIHSRSYAIWFNRQPHLKNELVKMGKEQNYGFVTRQSRFARKVKHYGKTVLVNGLTVHLLTMLGQMALRRRGELARQFFRHVYQYYFRTNLRRQTRLLAR